MDYTIGANSLLSTAKIVGAPAPPAFRHLLVLHDLGVL